MTQLLKKTIALFTFCAILLCLDACTMTENPSNKAETVYTTVIGIEKFGHVVLDITTADFIDSGFALGDVVYVCFGSYEATMPFYDGYYSTPGTEMLRGVSAQQNIALCINYGDFSKETGLGIGDQVTITMAEKAGMLEHYKHSVLQYSNHREDFSDDTVFANFREVTAGNIGDGTLYRSASPINNEFGRASYANTLIEEVGIATVLNLADSADELQVFFDAEDFASNYYLALYENGNVITLDLSSNFFSDEFNTSLIEGFRFLAKHEPPYDIHCTEGKDRAGFATMLLEALMGATLQEIIDDYMISFYNYYNIDNEEEPEKYETILENNLFPMLYHVTGTTTIEELTQTDLEVAVTMYLLSKGMTEPEILALKEALH